MSKGCLINEDIHEETVKLVLDGKMYGVISIKDALSIASERNLDLIEVLPPNKGELSICKIVDYGKLKYDKDKNRKKSKKEVTKEIRFGMNISSHDLSVKNNKVISLLQKKCKVKYTLKLKGRQNNYMDNAKDKIMENLSIFDDYGKWEKLNISNGCLTVLINPISK